MTNVAHVMTGGGLVQEAPRHDCAVCGARVHHGWLSIAHETNRVQSNVREYQHEEFTVWRCHECKSLHCQEQVDLQQYYARYPVKQHRLDFWARTAYREYLRRLRRVGLKKTDRVLDYGCGPGLLVQFLRERGFEHATGYDAHVQEFADRTCLSSQYDVVISQDVIEHAVDPVVFLDELARLVKPGGILCIGTPNAEGIDLARPEDFALSLHQPYHQHILSERALMALAHRSGLDPIAVHRRFYYDTLFPTVNYRFLKTYVRAAGNTLDAAFEEPNFGLFLRSPRLWLAALLGYFAAPRSEMMIMFRRG